MPGVIAFYAFLQLLKNHYPLDSAINLSYSRPLCESKLQ